MRLALPFMSAGAVQLDDRWLKEHISANAAPIAQIATQHSGYGHYGGPILNQTRRTGVLCIILCFALGIANIFHFHIIFIFSIVCL